MKALLSLFLVGLAFVGQAANTPKAPWDRVIMIGASATAGFTASEMLGGTNTPYYSLSRYFGAALKTPHEPVQNLGRAMFFMQPESMGLLQVKDALESSPTLVVGVDFLFWYCYGEIGSGPGRLRRFERGLKTLEAVRCPLILGDIPDASAALETGMLTKEQIPSATLLTEANRRLREWAGQRPHVTIVPLASFMRAALANEPITVRGQTLPQGKTRALLQEDKLHPTPRGAAVITLAVLDALHAARPGLSTNDVRWNPEEVFRLGYGHAGRTTNSVMKKEASQLPALK